MVTQRDDDVLTPEKTCQRWREVEAAMLKELNAWAELKRFSRKPRHLASNRIDVWVLRNKGEQPTSDARSGGGSSAEATKPVKTSRARLTVRGLIGASRRDIDRYAGTSARSSQRALVSEVVLRGRDICAADISPFYKE